MIHTERTYMDAQESITVMAFDALALSNHAPTPAQKLQHWQEYLNIVTGSVRLSQAYKRTLQEVRDAQHCAQSA